MGDFVNQCKKGIFALRIGWRMGGSAIQRKKGGFCTPGGILAVAVLLCLSAQTVAAKMPRAQQQALYEAQQAIQSKQYAKARKILTGYLDEHPKSQNSLLWYALGNAWYLSGNPGRAYAVYKKGFALNPRSLDLCLNLAKTAQDLGRYKSVAHYLQKAYGLKRPRDPDLLYQAGAAYYQAESLKNAKSVLDRLFRETRKHQRQWRKLYLQVCMDLGHWKRAEKMVENLLATHPTDREYWRLLADLRLRRDDHQGAASALEIAYQIEAPDKADWEALADIYFYLNAPVKAARTLKKAYGKDLSARECERLARAYEQAGSLARAVKYLDGAIQKAPTGSRYLEKGKLLYRHGRWKQAVSPLQSAIKHGADPAYARLLLGYCGLEVRDFDLAKAAFSALVGHGRYGEEAKMALEGIKAETEGAEKSDL